MTTKPWIVFDVGGVLELVDDDEWPAELWRRFARRFGLTDAEFTQIRLGADLPRIDVTTGTEALYWARLATALGVDETQRERMRADLWDAYCGTLNTELFDFARTLRPRANLAILSNSADGARDEEERRFGFSELFDPICYSHELGVSKPDPRVYELTLDRLNSGPEHVLFIDDQAANTEAAAALGIAVVLHTDNATTMRAVEAFLAEN